MSRQSELCLLRLRISELKLKQEQQLSQHFMTPQPVWEPFTPRLQQLQEAQRAPQFPLQQMFHQQLPMPPL